MPDGGGGRGRRNGDRFHGETDVARTKCVGEEHDNEDDGAKEHAGQEAVTKGINGRFFFLWKPHVQQMTTVIESSSLREEEDQFLWSLSPASY